MGKEEPLFSSARYRAMYARQIQIEHLMEEASEYCHPDDEYLGSLYAEWVGLEYSAIPLMRRGARHVRAGLKKEHP